MLPLVDGGGRSSRLEIGGREIPPCPPDEDADEKHARRRNTGRHAEEDAAADGGDHAPNAPMPRWKKLLYWAVGLLALLALATGGVLYWLHARHFESTDDAFIDGYISQVAAQVPGRVTRIAFADNQQVTAGRTRLVAAFDGVDYTSSAGLRVLLATVKAARQGGGDLRLASVGERVRGVLELSGFTRILKCYPDVAQAVASYPA